MRPPQQLVRQVNPVNNEQQEQAKALGLMLPTRSKRTTIIMIVGVISVLSAALWWWLGSSAAAPMLYKTSPAKRMDISLTVSATGRITPKDQVELSSELSGIVKEVYVDYNDKVTKGQKLALLDTSKLSSTVTQRRSSLRTANAQVSSAKASLEEAELNYSYNQKVWDNSGGKLPSQQEMDSSRVALVKAKAAVEQALANVDNAKAELDYAETDLAKSVIRSPIDGIVLSRSIEAGQTVASSLSAPTLFLLARDLKAMELIVDIDEADIGLIDVGQQAKFSVDAHAGRKFDAQISQIRLAQSSSGNAQASSSGVVSYSTVLNVNNDDLLLLPSMTAVTDVIVSSAANALVIENAALRYQPVVPSQAKAGGNSAVVGAFMPRRWGSNEKRAGTENSARDLMRERPATIWVLRDNQPQQIDIRIGISDGVFTRVVSGDLQEGDLVISDAVQVKK